MTGTEVNEGGTGTVRLRSFRPEKFSDGVKPFILSVSFNC